MGDLAVERKIVDPKVAGIGRAANLESDRVTLSETQAAAVETQAETRLPDEPRGAHDRQRGHRAAKRRRHDVYGDFRPDVRKQALDELDQLGFLTRIRHGARNNQGTLR